jgi:hypothetical protein
MIRVQKALLMAAAPVAIALTLAGCGRNQAQTSQTAAPAILLPPLPAALPLSSAPPAGPIVRAPRVAELPPARPIGYGYVPPDEDYAWIDRADMLFDTFGDAPPDYGFDYDGVDPWAWETVDGYEVVAEPIDDGYRYYYYDPGDEDPFLVSDPYYSYGYGDGRLVAVYAGGQLLGQAEAARQAEAASRYWARGQALRRADQAVDRHPVSAELWAQQRPVVAQARQRWDQIRAQAPAWQHYRASRPNGPAVARLQAERQLRAGAAQRFAQWQRRGMSGAAPRLYPASATRRSAEPIMRPEQPTLFAAPRARRMAAAPAPALPRVQAAPTLAGRTAFPPARAQQAAFRGQARPNLAAGRGAFRNAAPVRAQIAPRVAPAGRFAGAPMRAQRMTAMRRKAVPMQARRQAMLARQPARMQARATPMAARRAPSFAQRSVRMQARPMARFQPRPQPRMQFRAPAARAQFHAPAARMQFRAPPARVQYRAAPARPQFRAPPARSAPAPRAAPRAAPAARAAPPPRGGGGGRGHGR